VRGHLKGPPIYFKHFFQEFSFGARKK
jgi:hypothetical protein